MLLIMKKNFIGKSILSIAAISLTVSTFAGESHAQTKNVEAAKNTISIKQTLKTSK